MDRDVYQLLMERLGHPDSEILHKVLEISVTAEEASLLLELPLSTPELANKFNLDEKTVEDKLQHFKTRGLIVPSRHGYQFPRDVMVLQDTVLSSPPEFIPSELPKLWNEFYKSGWWRDLADASCNSQRPFFRIIPALGSVPDGTELLPWEDVTTLIEAASSFAVRDCPCRVMTKECNSPTHVCIQFNRRAEYTRERDIREHESKEQILKIALAAGESGLIPLVANVAGVEAMNYICNCCDCCCIAINSLKRADRIKDGLAPSRFIAKVNSELCNGCKLCSKRCRFDAVILENIPGSKKVKAKIDPDKCFGCGLCVLKCKPGAVKLELVRPPEHIPSANR